MRWALVASVIFLAACSSSREQLVAYTPQPGQGQYQQPVWLAPQPIPRTPEPDLCQALTFQTLVGQHEGAIYMAGLPGIKRVLKPAFTEDFETDYPRLPEDANPFVEVRDYLPGQTLYMPSITTVNDVTRLGAVVQDRLLVELDEEGYVDRVRCG